MSYKLTNCQKYKSKIIKQKVIKLIEFFPPIYGGENWKN